MIGVAPTELQELGSGSQPRSYTYYRNHVELVVQRAPVSFRKYLLLLIPLYPYLSIFYQAIYSSALNLIFVVRKLIGNPTLAPILSAIRHFLPALAVESVDWTRVLHASKVWNKLIIIVYLHIVQCACSTDSYAYAIFTRPSQHR